MLLVGHVVGVEEAQETDEAEGATDSIYDEDTDDQEGKDIVGEASVELYLSYQVKERGKEDIPEEPDADPGVETAHPRTRTCCR